MTPKKIKTATLERSLHTNYWQRTTELWESMKSNFLQEKWNAAVIDGVQAAISANDALTTAILGKRSISDNHMDAVWLFEQATQLAHPEQQNRLRNILSLKSHVEYGPSLVKPKEGQRVVQEVERFLMWVKAELTRVAG